MKSKGEKSEFQLVLSNSYHQQLSGPALLETKRLMDLMEQYIRYYAVGESHTAKAKRYDLEHFLGFLGSSRGGPANVLVADWTLQSTKDFVDDRLQFGESPSTVARRLATLKHFGRTIAERLPGYINPAREAKSPVVQQTKPKGLSAEQIEMLRHAAADLEKTSDPQKFVQFFTALRNRFLLELLLGTGLRADEVRVLRVAQLTPDNKWLRNVKTKGKRFRNVYVADELLPLLTNYLAQRSRILKEHGADTDVLEQGPLIVSIRGAHPERPESYGLNPKTIWRIISDFGIHVEKQSGEHLHPHLLRHTFAHGLLDSSRDVRLVAQALGHSDVRTTMRYTERTEEELAAAIEEKNRP